MQRQRLRPEGTPACSIALVGHYKHQHQSGGHYMNAYVLRFSRRQVQNVKRNG